MSLKKWQQEIASRHPIIRRWPKSQWPQVAKFNGWLPLPPKEQGNDTQN